MKTMKISKYLTRLAMILFIFLAMSRNANAQETAWRMEIPVKNNFKQAVIYMPGGPAYYFGIVGGKSMDPYNADYIAVSSIKNAKVVSSNKAVAKVMTSDKRGLHGFTVYPKKPGTINVTYTATVKGKKIIVKGKIIIKKFSNPFKSLKINGVEYKNKMKEKNLVCLTIGEGCGIYLTPKIKEGETKVQVSYKTNKNWEILTEKGEKGFCSSVDDGMNRSRKLVNGYKYKLKKEYDSLYFWIFAQNKITGETLLTMFDVWC